MNDALRTSRWLASFLVIGLMGCATGRSQSARLVEPEDQSAPAPQTLNDTGIFSPVVEINQIEEWAEGTTVERVEDETIYFKAPEGIPTPPPLKTRLSDIKFLDILEPRGDGAPYLLLAAKPCIGDECTRQNSEKKIFMITPDGRSHAAYTYPGKLMHPSKRKRVLFNGRSFYGKCLPNRGDVYLSVQGDKADRRRWLRQSVVVVEPGETHIKERMLIGRRRPRLRTIVRNVRRKRCKEIKGYTRRVDRSKIDISAHYKYRLRSKKKVN